MMPFIKPEPQEQRIHPLENNQAWPGPVPENKVAVKSEVNDAARVVRDLGGYFEARAEI